MDRTNIFFAFIVALLVIVFAYSATRGLYERTPYGSVLRSSVDIYRWALSLMVRNPWLPGISVVYDSLNLLTKNLEAPFELSIVQGYSIKKTWMFMFDPWFGVQFDPGRICHAIADSFAVPVSPRPAASPFFLTAVVPPLFALLMLIKKPGQNEEKSLERNWVAILFIASLLITIPSAFLQAVALQAQEAWLKAGGGRPWSIFIWSIVACSPGVALLFAWQVGLVACASRQLIYEGKTTMAHCLADLKDRIHVFAGRGLALVIGQMTIWLGIEALENIWARSYPRWQTIRTYSSPWIGALLHLATLVGPASIVLARFSATDAVIGGIVIWPPFFRKLGSFVLVGAAAFALPNIVLALDWRSHSMVYFTFPSLCYTILHSLMWTLTLIASIRWYYLHLPQILCEQGGATPWPIHDPSELNKEDEF